MALVFDVDELPYYHPEAFRLLAEAAGPELTAAALDPWFRQERLLDGLLARLGESAAASLLEELMFVPYRDPREIREARARLGLLPLPMEPPPGLLAADPLLLAQAFLRAEECFPVPAEARATLREVWEAEPRLREPEAAPALAAEAAAGLGRELESLIARGLVLRVESPAASGRFEDLLRLFDYPSFALLLRSLGPEELVVLASSGPGLSAKTLGALDARSAEALRAMAAARTAAPEAEEAARGRIIAALRSLVEDGHWLAWLRYVPGAGSAHQR